MGSFCRVLASPAVLEGIIDLPHPDLDEFTENFFALSELVNLNQDALLGSFFSFSFALAHFFFF